MWVKKLTQIFGLDLRSLALLRTSIALIGLADLILRARDLVAHYTDGGLLPRATLLQAFPQAHYDWWSVTFISGLWQVQAIIFILTALFFISLLLGYKTRLSTFFVWVFLVSIQARNPMVFQKSDDILVLILLWGFFLPWGAVYSLDASKKQPHDKQKNQILTVATFAYLTQIMLIYITAALLKSSPIWRGEGSAIFYALSSEHYTTLIGHILLSFPSWSLQILTHFVWWFELLGTFLLIIPVFNPFFKIIGIISIIGLQIGFGSGMQLQLFPWICSVAMFAFIPGIVWDWLRQVLPFKKQREFTLYYDNACGFCKKSVMVFKIFLFLPDANFLPAQDNPKILSLMNEKDSWIVEHQGKYFYRFDVFAALLSASPVFWPLEKLAKVKIIRTAGEKLYDVVSLNRKKICKIKHPSTTFIFEKQIFILLQSVAGLFIIIVIFWNISNVANVNFPKPLMPAAKAFHLDQKWDMFAPHPFLASYWYVLPGYLKDNSTVNILNKGGSLSWDTPEFIKDTYSDSRWQNYLMDLFGKRNTPLYISYGKYVCRQWNSSHSQEKQLNNFEVFVMSRQNNPNKPPEPYVRTFLWEYSCF